MSDREMRSYVFPVGERVGNWALDLEAELQRVGIQLKEAYDFQFREHTVRNRDRAIMHVTSSANRLFACIQNEIDEMWRRNHLLLQLLNQSRAQAEAAMRNELAAQQRVCELETKLAQAQKETDEANKRALSAELERARAEERVAHANAESQMARDHVMSLEDILKLAETIGVLELLIGQAEADRAPSCEALHLTPEQVASLGGMQKK